LRRYLVYRKKMKYADVWPIDKNAGKPRLYDPTSYPQIPAWPDGKKFALVLTHDVETAAGLKKCMQLAEIEERLGFRSSFNFVAGDYPVPASLRQHLTDRGFEIGIHGLHHDQNPFRSASIFKKQAIEINHYLKEWGSVGFRSPSMYHDLELLHHLDIEYDASTFDTDPFEPQPDGMGTIFPFWVPSSHDNQKGYIELPYTLPQDFLLFVLMQQENIDIWKKKLEWIAAQGGMALVITHPNYMKFNSTPSYDEYPAKYYEKFLEYIKSKYEDQYWHALPKEAARFWKVHYTNETKTVRPKIRVCMLAYSFYDNDARVRRYAETLVRRGDHVDVIALKKEGQEDHEVLDGVHIYRIQERLLNETGKLDYLYKLIKFLVKSTYHLTKKHVIAPYDIVHVHSVPDFEVFAALLTKLSGTRIILDIHDPVPDFFAAKFGTDAKNKYFKILSFIEYISTKFADHVITVTDFWRDRITERAQIEDGKISVILNLPDVRIFNYKNYTRITKSKNDFVLLYPGTLNKHCGIDIAIKAVSLVKNEIPSLKFMIYGSGREINNLQQLVDDLGLNDTVYFENPISLQFIPDIMSEADIGIALLSGFDEYSRQALNVKLFEFLSMGLPSIATRTNSIEYYLDEGTVMLSNPNDPEDVARCIRELYCDQDKRNELMERGLAFIQKNNSEVQMSNYLEIINKLTK